MLYCIDTSGKSHPSQKTVDAWIDTIEDEIAKVISSIGSDTGKRRLDNPSYLQRSIDSKGVVARLDFYKLVEMNTTISVKTIGKIGERKVRFFFII